MPCEFQNYYFKHRYVRKKKSSKALEEMTFCTLTISRLRYYEALLLYIENAGQISSLFATRSQSVLPQLFTPLQVVTVPCIWNPVIGAEAGLVFACGWRPKEVRKKTRSNDKNRSLIIWSNDVLLLGGGGKLVEFPLRQM